MIVPFLLTFCPTDSESLNDTYLIVFQHFFHYLVSSTLYQNGHSKFEFSLRRDRVGIHHDGTGIRKWAKSASESLNDSYLVVFQHFFHLYYD